MFIAKQDTSYIESREEKNLFSGDIDDLIFNDEEWHESEK